MYLGNKTISLKSPTKILPATSLTTSKAQQRIIFKSTTGGQTVLPPGQIIQLTGNQSINSGQLHQINIPGKGVSIFFRHKMFSYKSFGEFLDAVH